MSSPGRGSALLVVLLSVLPGCSGGPREIATIRQAQRLTLYEGLPHQMYESAALVAERKAKPTVELHGFPFYRETLELKEGDDENLKALLEDPRTFESFSDEKKCGGFHPDYAVEWSVAGQLHTCLICFGCGEVKMYGPTGETRYDIPQDPRKRLEALLEPYRKNRPPPGPASVGRAGAKPSRQSPPDRLS